MVQIQLNYLAILVAAVSSMITGFIWYGPLFGKEWMAVSGLTQEKMDASKKSGMGKMYVLTFIGSLIMSYVLANAIIFASSYLGIFGVSAGLMSGFINWLGFIAPVTMGYVLWDGKSLKYWILTNGYQLVNLLIMGVILAVWI